VVVDFPERRWAAGIKEIHVLVDERKLTHAEITAKRLAHNAVEGRDDESLLSQLLAEIDSAELRRSLGSTSRILRTKPNGSPTSRGRSTTKPSPSTFRCR